MDRILHLHRPITDSEEYQEPVSGTHSLEILHLDQAMLSRSYPSPPSDFGHRAPESQPFLGGGGQAGEVWDPFDHPPKVKSGLVCRAGREEAETVFR